MAIQIVLRKDHRAQGTYLPYVARAETPEEGGKDERRRCGDCE